jgi:protein-tyrosine-phosphatase
MSGDPKCLACEVLQEQGYRPEWGCTRRPGCVRADMGNPITEQHQSVTSPTAAGKEGGADIVERLRAKYAEMQRDRIEYLEDEITRLRATHDARVAELLAANTREVERRRQAERERDDAIENGAVQTPKLRNGVEMAVVQRAGRSAHSSAPRFDLVAHLHRQRAFSERTFGPGARTKGVVDHIRKELTEIEADPTDIMEWVDVIILAFDGAWRAGWEPEAIVAAIVAKQTRNEGRAWPDWRTADPDKAIEHDRSAENGCGNG